MELRIGENIKRLRKSKGLTQEQFAGFLNVSCAAVSKWESSDSFPDITMIFPIANVFGVSVDELMGYDAEKIKKEAEQLIADYSILQHKGNWHDASELIATARKNHPNDFKIMLTYIYDIIGGCADNNPEILKENYDEIIQLCDCILDRCTQEGIRLEAMTVKAKLLHATGKTKKALEILSQFPSWYQSSGQKSEQLFLKNTPEFRYWICRNLYELSDFTANKAIKKIWHENNVSASIRTSRCERVGDMYYEMYFKTNEVFFLISAEMSYAELAGKLTFNDEAVADIIRIRKKQIETVKIITEVAKEDMYLHEYLIWTYKTSDLVALLINELKTTKNRSSERMRQNTDYMDLLEQYTN